MGPFIDSNLEFNHLSLTVVIRTNYNITQIYRQIRITKTDLITERQTYSANENREPRH